MKFKNNYTIDRRSAFIEWVGINKVKITTPFLQKEFVVKNNDQIDLISLRLEKKDLNFQAMALQDSEDIIRLYIYGQDDYLGCCVAPNSYLFKTNIISEK